MSERKVSTTPARLDAIEGQLRDLMRARMTGREPTTRPVVMTGDEVMALAERDGRCGWCVDGFTICDVMCRQCGGTGKRREEGR